MDPLNTPFARKVLPRFAAWFDQVLEQEKPDYLVPVERKGAHLLDAVLSYLSRSHGTSVRASVLCRRTFSYLPPDALDGRRVLLLDDATHTGRSLHEYSHAVKECGNAQVRMVACLGLALPPDHPATTPRADIRCFIEAREDDYHEYLWQITELVITRGLPPELDHHRFRLTASDSLLKLWPRILSALANHGVLDVHGPPSHGATLHWPTFLSHDILPENGVVRKDGVVKLRLFTDFARDAVTVIPMVSPELHLPSSSATPDSLLQAINSWPGSSDPATRLVLDSARTMSHDVLFVAASLHYETALMQGFGEVLRQALGDATAVTVTSDRPSLFRLYGSHVGSTLADRLESQLATSTGVPATPPPGGPQGWAGHLTTDEINAEVNNATDELLRTLEEEYHQVNRGRPRDKWESVGLSFADLRQLHPFNSREDGALLLSRAIDLGCATGGLVPYTGYNDTHNHIVVVRKYRTAETVRARSGGLEDYRWYRRELAAEVVATVSSFLSRRSTRWRNQATPLFVLDKVVAILNGAAPEAADRRTLAVVPKEHGPEAAFAITPLVGKPSYRLVRTVTSEFYSVAKDGGIQATETFLGRYKDGSLRISQRDELLSLEGYLQALVPVLDACDDVTKLLTCWSISASGRLGLDYIMADVELALDSLAVPVDVLAGRRKLDPRRLIRSCERSRHYLGVALTGKLEPLTTEWAAPAVQRWTDPLAVESALLRSLGVPHDHKLLFAVAAAFIHAVKYVTEAVGNACGLASSEEQQGTFFVSDGPQDRTALRSEVIARLSRVCSRLRTLRDEGSHAHLGVGSEIDQNADLAMHYKDILEVLRRFASAFAWSYSRLVDLRGEELPDPSPRNRTILFADLAGSLPAALRLPHGDNVRWKNNSLDLIAQWGHAFGGREGVEVRKRKGDDICLEFPDPESAIICGAIIQEHLAVLRSTGLPENTCIFRMAVDSFWVSSADGGNLISLAIDRAAKMAKAEMPEEPENDRLKKMLITPEVVRDCSDRLRRCLSESSHLLRLGEGDRGEFHPWRVKSADLMRSYVARLHELA